MALSTPGVAVSIPTSCPGWLSEPYLNCRVRVRVRLRVRVKVRVRVRVRIRVSGEHR